jgi:hypothetical protein
MRYCKISVWDDMSSRGDGIVNYIPSDDDYQITSDALSEGIVVVYEHNDRSSVTYFVFIPETSQYFNIKLMHCNKHIQYFHLSGLTLRRQLSRYIDEVIEKIIIDALSKD